MSQDLVFVRSLSKDTITYTPVVVGEFNKPQTRKLGYFARRSSVLKQITTNDIVLITLQLGKITKIVKYIPARIESLHTRIRGMDVSGMNLRLQIKQFIITCILPEQLITLLTKFGCEDGSYIVVTLELTDNIRRDMTVTSLAKVKGKRR